MYTRVLQLSKALKFKTGGNIKVFKIILMYVAKYPKRYFLFGFVDLNFRETGGKF